MRLFAPLLVLALAGVAHADGPTGTIVGTVRYLGEVPPDRKIVTSDGAILRHNDLVVDAKTKGLCHVAVIVDANDAPAADKLPAAVLDQKDMLFLPRVLVVRAGQTVRFDNNDLCNHGVRSASARLEDNFDVLTPPGRPFEFRYARATKRPVSITCPIHSWMQAWVLVVPHPYHAVTGAQGKFRIPNVPAGKHKLRLVYPDTGRQQTLDVNVSAGKTVEVNVVWPETR